MAASQKIEGYFSLHGSSELPPQRDAEKGDPTQVYGTFTPASEMKAEAGEIIQGHRGLTGHVWLSLGAALIVVTAFALCAFVLASVLLG